VFRYGQSAIFLYQGEIGSFIHIRHNPDLSGLNRPYFLGDFVITTHAKRYIIKILSTQRCMKTEEHYKCLPFKN